MTCCVCPSGSVFWRIKGHREAHKNDTASTELLITGMREGETYEVAVKAGNHKGTSVLTRTATYNHTMSSVTRASTPGTSLAGPENDALILIVTSAIFFLSPRAM